MGDEPADIRQCREYLRQLGFGHRELAVLDPSDSKDIARQLASELNLPTRNTLVSFVEKLVQDSKEPAKLAARADGQLASYVEWINSWGGPRGSDRDRQRVGATCWRQEIAFREDDSSGRRERSTSASLAGNLDGAASGRAPAYGCASVEEIGKLSGQDSCRKDATGENPGHDSQEVRQLLSKWRQWLQEAKAVSMPGTEADLIGCLMARWEEPCGRTIPEILLKAVTWMERVAEFPDSSRTTTGRAVWSIKDRIVEALSIDAPVTKRAPRYPVFLLAIIERDTSWTKASRRYGVS